MDSVRAKHAAELEAKRKKLEEIRKRKASVRAAEEASSIDTATKVAIDQQESKFDDFIQNILKTSGGEGEAAASGDPAVEQAAPSGPPTLSLAEKLASLSTLNGVAELHIQPILVETYTKHTQTDITLEDEIAVAETGTGDMEVDASAGSQSPPKTDMPSSPRRAIALDAALSDEAAAAAAAAPALSEEEKKQILESEEMDAFLSRASRVIERALNSASKFDIMVDYGATVEQDTLMEEATESLKQQFAFTGDKWSKHRAVTDVDVSPFYPELTLVAYSARDFLDDEESDTSGSRQWDTMGNSASEAPALTDVSSLTDGVVLLWSTALPSRPEYRFTCHSQVTSACFNPFDRHLVLGGTYSGQIVVWDTRAKAAPVRKTSLSSCSHTHPIYAMAVVGTKSTYHLVSASTDGRVCVWDIDQLQQPLDMMDLRIALSIVSSYATANLSDKKMEASVTAFALPRKESHELFVGTEAGKIYSTTLEQQKSKAGGGATGPGDSADPAADGKSALPLGADASVAREVVVTATSPPDTAHFGPITAMHFNPVVPPHADALLLTASLDSSVKLWSPERAQAPLLSFEPSSEYICDVRWSPVHPALFAVADGSGLVSLWNILKDTEVPVVATKAGQKALNKLRWAADGRSVILGDATGAALILEVPAEIALPLPDDLAQMETKMASAVAVAIAANAAVGSLPKP